MNSTIEHDPVFYVAARETDEGEEYAGWESGWYFWNETWSDECGPFKSEGMARTALDEYARQLMGAPYDA